MLGRFTVTLALLCASVVGPASVRAQEAPQPSLSAPTERPRRLFTAVVRAGGQFGVWGGTLRLEAREDGDELIGANLDASGNAGVLLGTEGLFRFRSGFRLGAGVLVMPALSFDIEMPEGGEESFTAGTAVRIPSIFEWEFALSEPVSLVVGVVPSIIVLARGEQSKNWGRAVCPDSSCKYENGIGVAIEGEIGAMVWLGSHALRTDLRFGLESLETGSARQGDAEFSQTLVGPRLSLLLGFEI